MSPPWLSPSEHEKLESVLVKFERRWTPKLDTASLIAEVSFPDAALERVFNSLTVLNEHKHDRLLKILPHIPATVAAAVTSMAIDRYEGGAFWPGFFEGLGATETQKDRVAWGDAFLHALDHFSMPAFSGSTRKYIVPIVAHAGIPNYCLRDYFAALDLGMRRVGPDASAITTWAVPRVETTLRTFDVPVRDFLARGDEYAMDYVDRSLDLLIRLARDDDPAPALLPDRMVGAARSYLEELGARVFGETASNSRGAVQLARVHLDPLEGEVKLTLPAIPDLDEDLTWIVLADAHESRVVPQKSMGGRRIGIRETSHSITRPARVIRVATQKSAREQEIDLVDPDDPLVLFSDDGSLLPGHLPIPAGQVWALFATEPSAEPLFAPQITHEQSPPLGWVGWRLCRVNLVGSSLLQLSNASAVHRVRNDARVNLETLATAPLARSGGLPVHTKRPVVHIPDGVDADWHLTIIDLSTSQTVVDRVLTSSAAVHDTADPFEGLAAPVVGRFALSVRGPLGKGLARELAVAEGLSVVPSTRFRTFAPDGLQPATVHVSGANILANPSQMMFGPQDVERPVLLTADANELDVLIAPMAMAVSLISDERGAEWQYGPVSCTTEDLETSALLVRLPLDGTAAARVVSDGKEELQILGSSTKPLDTQTEGSGFQARFALGMASDTVRRAGAATVVLGIEPPIRLLRIEPARIAVGAEVVDDNIVLTEFHGGEVVARTWSIWEPWREPEDFHFGPDGTAELPRSLRGVGPLALAVRHSDPWLPTPMPDVPDRDRDFFIGLPVGANAPMSTIALNTSDPHPEPLRDDDAWALLAMRENSPRHYFPQDTTDALVSGLAARPARSLGALAERDDSTSQKLALLVASTVLWTALEPPTERSVARPSDEALARVLGAQPMIGALIITRHIARRDEANALPLSAATASEVLGFAYRDILEGHADPEATAGKLDQTLLLDAMSKAQFTAMVASMNMVPKAFLDRDTRASAAIELFEQRWHPKLRDVARLAPQIVDVVASMFERDGAESLTAAIRARMPGSTNELPIARIGAASLALAAMARMAARAHQPSEALIPTYRPHLERLARRAPHLLSCDIVLAEAHIAAMLETDHPTFRATLDESDLQ